MEKLRNRLTDGRSRSELQDLINEWVIGCNGERNRKIVEMYLFDGIPLEDISEKFDMSTQGICDIIYPKCQMLLTKLKPKENL